MLFHPLSRLQYDRYVQTLGGLTKDNEAQVAAQLRKLVPEQTRVGQAVGVRPQVIFSDDGDTANSGTQTAVLQLQAQVEKVLQLLEKSAGNRAAGAHVHQQANMSVATVATPAGAEEVELRLKDRSAPNWAKALRNARGLIAYDDAQYIALIGLKGTLIEGLMDTGGACTIMDMEFARRLGFAVVEQRNAEFGLFSVPGRSTPLPYAGCVEGPVQLQFAADVVVTMPFIRLVNHGRPLFIVGATDVLCAGPASPGSHEFMGMGPHQLQGQRGTQGWVRFGRGTSMVDVPLVSAPVRGLKFVRRADDELHSGEGLASAVATVKKQQVEREKELMRPTMHAMAGQPDPAAGALKKLERSF